MSEYSVYLDVGNTTIHLGVWDGEWSYEKRTTLSGVHTEGDWMELLKEPLEEADLAVESCVAVVACVTTSEAGALFDAVESVFDRGALLVGRDLTVPLPVNYDDPQTMGRDRLVAAFGADRLIGRPCVIVDAGTYITCDALSKDACVNPVAIAAGLPVLQKGGEAVAKHLPRIGVDIEISDLQTAVPPAVSTEDCMAFGAASTLGGGADRMIAAARNIIHADEDNDRTMVDTVFTGGDAKLIQSLATESGRVHETLCLDGLRILDQQ